MSHSRVAARSLAALLLSATACVGWNRTARGEEVAAATESAAQAVLERPEAQAAAIAELGWITADGRVLKSANADEAVALYRSRSLRRVGRRFMSPEEPLDRVGGLTSHHQWREGLPLAELQVAALRKLDLLVREAWNLRWLADADEPAEDLASYEAYLQRSFERHSATIGQAQRMVMTGLLTPSQAEFVWQRWLGKRRLSNALYDDQLRDMLGLTAEQRHEIEHIANKYRSEFVTPSLWEVLTENQRATLTQLKAERKLAAEPPELPSLEALAADGATVELGELSPVFRVLKAPYGTAFQIALQKPASLGLTSHQRRLIADLEEATRLGWLWIGLRNSDQRGANPADDAAPAASNSVEEVRRGFLNAAEQVALLGILSEEQAKQLAAAVAGR